MRDRRPRTPNRDDKFRVNENITSPEVLLIGDKGEQHGVVKIEKALQIAEQEGLDLVEVAGDASPPVCRLLDYGKLKYKESKKAAEAKKKTASHTIKELRVRYNTDTHDLDTKIRRAKKFISNGDRVKFQMRFRGREVAYKTLGDEIFDQITEMLAEIAEVEQRTPLVGNTMTLNFVPK